MLSSALRLGGSHLSVNPDSLGFDLLGRLLHHYNDRDLSGKPSTSGSSSSYKEDDDANNNNNNNGVSVSSNGVDTVDETPGEVTNTAAVGYGRSVRTKPANIKTLLQQCDSESTRHSALLPVLQCFDPPTALSLYILEGHSQVCR